MNKIINNIASKLFSISVCFTPGQNCTEVIINSINNAHKEIIVQAYSFTDMDIAKALINAHKRGVNIYILLDKRNIGNKVYISLINDSEKINIDKVIGLSHNKIIIIDRKIIITGSFNYTKAAQFRNSENLIVIDDLNIVKKYLKNYNNRIYNLK